MSDVIVWALLWRSCNKLDGRREHIVYKNCLPALFRTREQARRFAAQEYGYIRRRKDLRTEPHGWRIPKPVRVSVNVLPGGEA